MDPVTLSLSGFKDILRAKKEVPGELRLIKGIVASSAKVADPAKRMLDVRITTATRDRDSDTIDPKGWQLANFRKNPVVLFCHNYSMLPVAKDGGIQQDEIGLRGSPIFATADMNPLADTCYKMYSEGFLNAFSVGMKPQEWKYNEQENGVDFLVQELLEYSCVPVPANPEALNGAKSAGIDLRPVVAWATEVLDTWAPDKGLFVPREKVERALKILEGERTIVLVPGRFTEAEAKTFAQASNASLVLFQQAPHPAAPTKGADDAQAGDSGPVPQPDEPAPEAPAAAGGTADETLVEIEAVEEPAEPTIELDEETVRSAIGAGLKDALGEFRRSLTGALD